MYSEARTKANLLVQLVRTSIITGKDIRLIECWHFKPGCLIKLGSLKNDIPRTFPLTLQTTLDFAADKSLLYWCSMRLLNSGRPNVLIEYINDELKALKLVPSSCGVGYDGKCSY